MSSFLQERLQRERKLESERTSRRLSADLSASADFTMRATQSSPVRGRQADSHRPRSSSGGDPATGKKKGMGLKEMEQVCGFRAPLSRLARPESGTDHASQTLSTLHKQNFDLKLELFHRRERQTSLEARIEELEAENSRLMKTHEEMMEQMEKRDKAINEAVAMIVSLEAKVDQLAREREMVRQVEADGFYRSRSNTGDTAEISTPRKTSLDLGGLDDDSRTLARVPSFLSDFTENTENLRHVYLGVRGSLLSLRKASDVIDREGMASPSLSVLSESSFVSVYGKKQHAHHRSASSNQSKDLVAAAAGQTEPSDSKNDAAGGRFSRERRSTSSRAPPSRGGRRRSTSRSGDNGHIALVDVPKEPLHPFTPSPLQRLERIHSDMSKSMFGSPETQSSEPSRLSKSPSQPKTKQEKRAALQRVLTDGAAKDLANIHALPPTPDTISTSTLRNYKNSTDTLSQQPCTKNDGSHLALSETTVSQSVAGDKAFDGRSDKHPPSHSAFNSRRDIMDSSFFDTKPALMQRPRSAGETTVSNRQEHWDFDSDSDVNSVSSYDPWIRESFKPNRVTGRTSPDLFSFPTTTSGWATDAIFGNLQGSGFMGAPVSALKRDPLDEPLGTPQTALFAAGLSTPGAAPPPPPNRRSSLHAQTGSTSATRGSSSSAQARRQSPLRGGAPSMSRSGSSDGRGSSSQAPQAQKQPPQQQPAPVASAPPPQDGKSKNHYPPIAGQQPRERRGLNSLFRRSGSESAPSSAGPLETTFAAAAGRSGGSCGLGAGGLIGIPSWGHRGPLLDDDRESATPPPILRNRVPGRSSLDGDRPSQHGWDRYPQQQQQQQQHQQQQPQHRRQQSQQYQPSGFQPVSSPLKDSAIPPSASAPNGQPMTASGSSTITSPNGMVGGTLRRKWLGLARVGSLKSRATG